MLSSIAAARAAAGGEDRRNAAVNQRASTCSVIAAIPAVRTRAARSSQREAGGRWGDVQHRPSAAIRAGACAASHMPIMPPSEIPA